jgi:hypothetical protein
MAGKISKDCGEGGSVDGDEPVGSQSSIGDTWHERNYELVQRLREGGKLPWGFRYKAAIEQRYTWGD